MNLRQKILLGVFVLVGILAVWFISWLLPESIKSLIGSFAIGWWGGIVINKVWVKTEEFYRKKREALELDRREVLEKIFSDSENL